MAYRPRQIQSAFPVHITARSNNRERFPLSLEELWEIFENHLFFLHHAFGLRIISFVLMPNHFHLICLDPEGTLSDAMAYFLRETSREVGRRSGMINHKWGGPYHSSVIDSPLYFLHAYKYVYRNPVTAGLCTLVEEYPFSTLHGLIGRRHLAIPLAEDSTLFSTSVTSTLQWLNRALDANDGEIIRKALKKPAFCLPKDATKRRSKLEVWESVPFDATAYHF